MSDDAPCSETERPIDQIAAERAPMMRIDAGLFSDGGLEDHAAGLQHHLLDDGFRQRLAIGRRHPAGKGGAAQEQLGADLGRFHAPAGLTAEHMGGIGGGEATDDHQAAIDQARQMPADGRAEDRGRPEPPARPPKLPRLSSGPRSDLRHRCRVAAGEARTWPR